MRIYRPEHRTGFRRPERREPARLKIRRSALLCFRSTGVKIAVGGRVFNRQGAARARKDGLRRLPAGSAGCKRGDESDAEDGLREISHGLPLPKF